MSAQLVRISAYPRKIDEALKCPIARDVVGDRARIRSALQADRFVVVPDFLRKSIADQVRQACEQGHYATFCAYTVPGADDDLRNAFCEPNETDVYTTIHERLTEPVPALDRFAAMFENRETIDAISSITGFRISRGMEPGVVTYWPPGSFLEAHTDFAEENDAKLVLSVSLTANWYPSYGGATVYAFSGATHSLRLQPTFNSAVLFVPFSGSWHWVEQIAENAPALRRFTWTAFFE